MHMIIKNTMVTRGSIGALGKTRLHGNEISSLLSTSERSKLVILDLNGVLIHRQRMVSEI